MKKTSLYGMGLQTPNEDLVGSLMAVSIISRELAKELMGMICSEQIGDSHPECNKDVKGLQSPNHCCGCAHCNDRYSKQSF